MHATIAALPKVTILINTDHSPSTDANGDAVLILCRPSRPVSSFSLSVRAPRCAYTALRQSDSRFLQTTKTSNEMISVRVPSSSVFVLALMCTVLLLTPEWWAASSAGSSSLVAAYKVKHTTDPSFECSGCARTRLIGCFGGQCSYRCYRSCTNGTNIVIEAHRFVLEGQRKRRKRWIGADM